MLDPPVLQVRLAGPADPLIDAVGALTADVYVGDGHTAADSPYTSELAAAHRRAAEADLLVAEIGGRLAGAVTFATHESPWAELARPGDAEFRMLVVDPAARGRGVGTALVDACLQRARALGCRRMVLSTQAEMAAAHRIYERRGFRRTPDRDWSPAPGVDLITYGLDLQPDSAGTEQVAPAQIGLRTDGGKAVPNDDDIPDQQR